MTMNAETRKILEQGDEMPVKERVVRRYSDRMMRSQKNTQEETHSQGDHYAYPNRQP